MTHQVLKSALKPQTNFNKWFHIVALLVTDTATWGIKYFTSMSYKIFYSGNINQSTGSQNSGYCKSNKNPECYNDLTGILHIIL